MTSKPIHPLLFASFPVLFLVAHNRDVTTISEAFLPLVLTLASVIAVLLVGSVASGSPRKVAVVLSVVSLLFFSYGHVFDVLRGHPVAGVRINDLVLTIVWCVLANLALVVVARTRKPLLDLTRVLNIVGLVLVVTTLATVGAGSVRAEPSDRAAAPNAFRLERPAHPRDVYYLIFDRYADAETLKTHLAFDNRPFIGSLERKGFVVEPGSRANYQNTHMSLASSMNLQHFDTLAKGVAKPSKNLEPIFGWIKRSALASSLKSVGYTYVHVGSWASFTASSPIADVNLKPVETSELTRALYGSTALSPLLRRGGAETATDSETQRDSTRGALRALDKAMGIRGPKFVFTHFILPHPPYVFDRNGAYSPETQRSGNAHGYLEQVRFANSQIDRIVTKLLSVPPDEQPIIVIQADEGPYPGLGQRFPDSWSKEPAGDVRVKYGILNAYYLPGSVPAAAAGHAVVAPYPTISPVNSFRMIFNRYFGSHLALLPDESYATASKADAYTLVPLGGLTRGTPSRFPATP